MPRQTRSLVYRLARFDRSAVQWGTSVRLGLVSGACVFVGAGIGRLPEGLTASLGALLVGFLDHREPYQQRAQSMLVGIAVTTPVVFVAGLVDEPVWRHIVVASVAALACGLAAAWGPRLGQTAVLALVLFAVYSGAQAPVSVSLTVALSFVTGAFVQVVVCLSGWVWRRSPDTPAPVAAAWRVLGLAVERGTNAVLAAAVTDAAEAAKARAESLPLGSPDSDTMHRLVGDVTDVRWGIVVTAPRAGNPRGTLPAPYLEAVGRACIAISRAITMRRRIKPAGQAVASVVTSPPVAVEARLDRSRIDHALSGALSATVSLHRPGGRATGGGYVPSSPVYTRPLALGWASPVVQQAVRLCVTFTVATALGIALLQEHAYWVPLTVAIVTQPGYAGTISKALARVVGTLAGILLAAAVIHGSPPGEWLLAVVTTATAIGIYLFAAANYAIAVVFITLFVVLVIEQSHGPVGRALLFRGAATLLGGAIVVAGAMVAPQRSAPRLSRDLAELAECILAYVELAGQGRAGTDAWEAALAKGRRARSTVTVTLDEAWAEPGRHGLDPRIGQRVFRELSAVLLYGADLADGVADRHDPEVGSVLTGLTGLAELAGRLRGVAPDGTVPPRRTGSTAPAGGPAADRLAAAQLVLDSGEASEPAPLSGVEGKR